MDLPSRWRQSPAPSSHTRQSQSSRAKNFGRLADVSLQMIATSTARALGGLAAVILAGIAALGGAAVPALAHGPCLNCLEPGAGPPGTRVHVAAEGVLAVWNPRPNMLALGVPGNSTECSIKCAGAKPTYHYDEPMVVLAESNKREPMSFTVPDATPGRYLVVIYNGSESGFHYTWDFFTVKAATTSPTTESHNRTGWLQVALAVIGAATIFVAGFLIGRQQNWGQDPDPNVL